MHGDAEPLRAGYRLGDPPLLGSAGEDEPEAQLVARLNSVGFRVLSFSDELGCYTDSTHADRQAGRQAGTWQRPAGTSGADTGASWGDVGFPQAGPGHAFGFQRTLSAGRQAGVSPNLHVRPRANARKF